MAAFNEISPAKLMRLIGTPDCPAIVDVCINADFDADPFLVPTAFRNPHTELAQLAGRLGTSKTIVICQKGLKLSHGVASLLREQGIDAQVLAGGQYCLARRGAAPCARRCHPRPAMGDAAQTQD